MIFAPLFSFILTGDYVDFTFIIIRVNEFTLVAIGQFLLLLTGAFFTFLRFIIMDKVEEERQFYMRGEKTAMPTV
jgi:hypothetical protein